MDLIRGTCGLAPSPRAGMNVVPMLNWACLDAPVAPLRWSPIRGLGKKKHDARSGGFYLNHHIPSASIKLSMINLRTDGPIQPRHSFFVDGELPRVVLWRDRAHRFRGIVVLSRRRCHGCLQRLYCISSSWRPTLTCPSLISQLSGQLSASVYSERFSQEICPERRIRCDVPKAIPVPDVG